MGLSSLSTALSGLKINQQQIDIISNNVSNVGTEGYTRKILPQSTQAVDGRAIGVLGGDILRNVDLRLQRDLWTQVSQVSFYDSQVNYLQRVDNFHGAPDANISIAAEITALQDTFASLADAPTDQFRLASVVDQATDTAEKINELGTFYTTLRNDVQDKAEVVIQSINDLLEQITELNTQIRFSTIGGDSVATLEDKRDQAAKELSSFIEVSSFRRGDGVLVVQTQNGTELASDTVQPLSFRPRALSAVSSYPENVAGIFVGDPLENPSAPDITTTDLGGELGSLIQLRDSIFPKQQAQLDELAHKLALRFNAQGLRLFTDSAGGIPADTPPDTSTDPATPVPYVGFSSEIQINQQIVNDHTLLQRGTFGGTPQTGSNEVIRRVIEFTFGNTAYQLAANTDPATSVDIRSFATGGTTLQDWLGLRSTNTLTSGLNLSSYASVADIVNAGGTDVFGSGASQNDTFIFRFDDPDIGGGPYDIEIDLRAVAAGGTSAADDLVTHITADPDWANVVADFGATVSVNADGELEIQSRSDIQVVNSATSPMNAQGFAFVGFSEETVTAQDPYFDVQVKNNDPVRITLDPLDTETELLAKLNAVEGLVANIDADGFLSLRPGDDFNNPSFGGDISIIGGSFSTLSPALAGTAAGRTSIDNNVNIAQALFGTYSVTGGVVEHASPITDIPYGSETEAGSNSFVPFRSDLLGANATISTEIDIGLTLKDYGQKIISELAQELSLAQARQEDESAVSGLLEQQLLNQSGVNIDEELGNLIVVQTAYAASARVINAVEEIFQELLNII